MAGINGSRKACNSNEANKLTSEEEARKILNMFGKFQVRSLLMLFPAFMLGGTTTMAPVFLNVVPNYECQRSPSNYSQLNFSPAPTLNHSSAEASDPWCSRLNLVTNLTTGACLDERVYDLSFGNTVVSQFDLVCDSAWKRPLAVASMIFGMMFGSLIGGPLSDRFGRRKVALMTFALFTLFQLVVSFLRHYWFYVIVLFVIGVVMYTNHLTLYVWAQELVHSADKRALAGFVLSFGFGVGGMLMSLIAYLVVDWDWMFRAIAIISALCFPLLCLVPESPIWLLHSGRARDGLRIVKKIADVNGITIDSKNTALDNCIHEGKTTKKSNEREISPLLLLRNKVLCQRQLLICFLWLVSYSSYTTMIYNSGNLGGNIYINNLIGCGLDVTSVVMTTVMLKRYSRGNTMAFLFAMITCFGISSPLVKKAHLTAGIAFALIGRFFCTASTWTLLLYNGELFPTLLRNTSVGIGTLAGKLASIASPFLIFAGEEVDLSIPFYVVGGMSMLGLLATLLLPESPKNSLPDSLEEALALKSRFRLNQCNCSRSMVTGSKEAEKAGYKSPDKLITIA